MLRALQESEFERVGGIKTIKVDVRLVTATNRDLEQEVKNGNFRDDLYYRLNVVPLTIPPLRDRGDDTKLLVEHIIQKFNQRLSKNIEGISDEAMDALQKHHWPGNIRELENVLERTMLFCSDETIGIGDIPNDITQLRPTSEHAYPRPGTEESLEVDENTSLKDVVRAETNRVEKELIVKALEETTGNVTQAAKLLKISRKSLQTKMKDFGLRDKETN